MSKLTMTRRAFVAAGSLLLAGCGAKEEPAQTQPAEEAAAEQKPAEDAPAAEATSTGSAKDKRILVAFYSRADENYPGEWLEVGHTKVMAGYIAEALGADTYEIVPVEPYPEGYDDCCDQALEEQRNDARPAIAEALPEGIALDTYRSRPGIIEARYSGGTLVVRKSVTLSGSDLSGDFNASSQSWDHHIKG